MRTVKTRTSVKNIKALDKPVNLAGRTKNSLVKVKERAQSADRQAEETQNPQSATPTDYASENIQATAQNAAREIVHNPINPRQKAAENWNRAKNHFREVRQNLPKERRRAAQEAQNLARRATSTADKRQKTAEQAKETAIDAKSAVKDAKRTLKEVRQSGRLKIREAKIKLKADYTRVSDSGATHSPASAANHNIRTSEAPPNQLFDRPANSALREASQPFGEITRNPKSANLNPARSDVPRTSPTQARKSAAPGKPPSATPSKSDMPARVPEAAPKRGIFNVRSANPARSANDAAATFQTTGKAAKSAKKELKRTAKGTIKAAKKSVKTAEKTAKSTIKTAKQAAKAAHKTAQTSARAAKAAARAAQATAKAAVHTAKAAARAITALVKASVAAVKGLVTAIAAGGWVAVLIILIVCLIGPLVGSVFGIFFSGEDSGSGQTINSVIREIDGEYQARIDGIIAGNAHDLLDMSGAWASWKEVLTVYTVRTVSDPDNPNEAATIDGAKAGILRSVFWEMNTITHSLETVDVAEDVLDAGGEPTGETAIVTKTVLRINVAHKTVEDAAAAYSFSAAQNLQLTELLKPDYHSLWNTLLYGVSGVGDGSMIGVAETQIGNIGGEPYWKWYGFTSRVEWCAVFVSWCAEQCGFLESGAIPMFSSCEAGIDWFDERELWRDSGYTPAPGDLIFFDWEGDGLSDHVGIVEYVADGVVHTIEGNTSDSVARRSYAQGSGKIMGYGTPQKSA